MEHEKNFIRKDGSIFAGAIFMSNRVTKDECLQRKLFGLPYSKAKFLKQVKAGMILFLFEHEKRRLYGVFEATSDGALNIIPNAFKSTGQSFPAQILFKRIWICRPLCEDEFRSAIAENYYSSNKFHFGLSIEQVRTLIQLFYLRKLNGNQDLNSDTDRVRLTEGETYVKCENNDYCREGNLEARRQNALPHSSMDALINHKRHTSSMQRTATDTGTGSNQVNFRMIEAQQPYPRHSYSETINPQQSSVCLADDHVTFHLLPFGKQHITTSGIDYNKPLPRQSACYTSRLDDVVVPYNPDVPEFYLPCNNMNPRAIQIQGADEFKPLHVVGDDCPQTAGLRNTSVYGAQPNRLYEFPDYIPLPEVPQQNLHDGENQNFNVGNYENVSTSLSYCIPKTCKRTSEAFRGVVANTNRRKEGGDYPAAVVDGRLHSDNDLGRPSVFSRLSRDQNVYDHETSDSSTEFSLEQLYSMIAERSERWSSRKVSEELMEWCSNEQYNCTVSTDLFNQSNRHQIKFALKPEERSNNDVHEGITEMENTGYITPFDYDQTEDLAEGCFELPFYNFRRRNASQKSKVQDDLNTCIDASGSEATSAKSKRRRILRPSLHQEKQNANEEAEMKKSTETKEETHEEAPVRAILECEIDVNVPCDQAPLKSETEGESCEMNRATSIDGTEDYIPLD